MLVSRRHGCLGLLCISLALLGSMARAAESTSEQRIIGGGGGSLAFDLLAPGLLALGRRKSRCA